MASDEHEKLIFLADVSKLEWLPRRNGKSIHIATVYRWANSGVRGRKLRTVLVGGSLATTESWVQDFFEINPRPSPPPVSRKRAKAIEKAERELEEYGI